MSANKLPKNAQAIKDWIEVNRPDLKDSIEILLQQDTFILMTTIGFEAGRKFQIENPDLPLGPQAYL